MVIHTRLNDVLKALIGERAEGLDLARAIGPTPPEQPGDIAFATFPLARALREPPPAIAASLAAQLQPDGLIAGARAVGPYLNVDIDPSAWLGAIAEALARDELQPPQVGAGRSVMVEFSQPNTHKAFHVGHLRNVATGDCLARLLAATGWRVVAANYYGDFGIDVAKCLWWLRTHDPDPPEGDWCTHLGAAYHAANDAIDPKRVDPETRQQGLQGVRGVMAALEAREPEVWALYQRTRQRCLDEFAQIYDWLDVRFDVDFYESELEAAGQQIVDDGLAAGTFRVSEGAVVADLGEGFDKPALVRKRDGSSLYMTWDLALARRKFDEYGVDRSLYVVGSEQKLHFRQLFATLDRLGYGSDTCAHVAYELVVLPTGKMSSREGTAIPLSTLQREVSAMIAAYMEEKDAPDEVLSEAARRRRARLARTDRDETIRRISAACLKYGMLSVGSNKRVVFSLDAWTQAKGNTGVYLQYCAARMRSVLEEEGSAWQLGDPLGPCPAFGTDTERALLARLDRFPVEVGRAADQLEPAILASWAHETAAAFSAWWHSCSIKDASGALRVHRIALVRATERAFAEALRLLGITPVDAM